MTLLRDILASDAVYRLGWTLLHSIWQGVAIATVLLAVLWGLRRRSPNARYLTACIALIMMMAAPVVTFWLVPAPVAHSSPAGQEGHSVALDPVSQGGPQGQQPSPFAAQIPDEPSTLSRPTVLSGMSSPTQPSSDEAPPSQVAIGKAASGRRDALHTASVSRSLAQALPWIGLLWLVSVFGLSLWRLGGWIAACRLKRVGTRPAGKELTATLARLAGMMCVSKPVALIQSMLVRVPTVIGWLKPVVLVPASMLSSLPPDQLEALLAHELAHIRRYDYLVNLLQTIVETILFYHPAMWWISSRIREEREQCCDDEAIGVCTSRETYAAALAAVAEFRESGTRWAVAISGGGRGHRRGHSEVLRRIRRVVGLPRDEDVGKRTWLAATTYLLIATAALVVFLCAWGGRELMAGPGTAAAWGEPVDGLRCRLELPDAPILAGDEVDVTFVLQNCSERTIKLVDAVDQYGEYCFGFVLRDEKGAVLDVEPSTMLEYRRFGTRIHVVEPGEAYRRTVALHRWNDKATGKGVLGSPGRYELIGKYDSHRVVPDEHAGQDSGNWRGELSSAPVELVVHPASTSAWGEAVGGLQCRATAPVEIEQGMPLETTFEVRSVPDKLEPGVKHLNTFLQDAFLTLHLKNARTGDVIAVQPYDPTLGMPQSDEGKAVERLNGSPLKPWKVSFPLVRARDTLEPGEYECTVEYSFPSEPTRWWDRRKDWGSFGFWSGTVSSGTFQLSVLKETPKTRVLLLPKRLRYSKLERRVYYTKEDAVEVEVPVRNGCVMAAFIDKPGGHCQSGVPQPDDVNGIDRNIDIAEGGEASYTFEVFETSQPVGHFWDPHMSGDYKVLWKNTLTVSHPESPEPAKSEEKAATDESSLPDTQRVEKAEGPLVVAITDSQLPCAVGQVKLGSAWNVPYRYVFHSFPEYLAGCPHIFMRQEGGGATGRWFETGQIRVSKPCWLYAAVHNASNEQRETWQQEGWEILHDTLQDLGDPRRSPREVRDYALMRKPIPAGLVDFETKAKKTNMVIWIFRDAAAGGPQLPSPSTPDWIDLLKLVDPVADAVAGKWTVMDGTLVSDGTDSARISFPYEPPAEYDYLIEFSVTDPLACTAQLVSKGEVPFTWSMNAGSPQRCRIEDINGHSVIGNPTRRVFCPFEVGKKHTSVVEVRNDCVRCLIDGKLIAEYATDYSDLSRNPKWTMPHQLRLGVGTWVGPTTFYRAAVRPVAGRGQLIRTMAEQHGEQKEGAERIVYLNDFEGDVGPEWSNRKTDVTPKGKRRFLGQFANETVTLHLKDLLPHKEVTVSFDLCVIRSWDGNHPVHGRDVWSLTARDVGTLLHTTFSNWPEAGQSYPESYGEGDFPMKTGAAEKGTLGYAFRDLTDSVYQLSFTFPHTGHELTLHFSATGLEGPVDLESWGLDNVRVTAHADVPSPDRVTPDKTVTDSADESEGGMTKEKATQRVLQTLGLPDAPTTVTAEQIVLPENPVPCIKLKSGERKGWQVVLDGVVLKGKNGTRTVTNPYIRMLTVTLASQTDQVIEVRSPEPEGDPSIWPFPAVEEHEKQLIGTPWRWVDLPEAGPQVTLMAALSEAVGGFANARQVIAYYVDATHELSLPNGQRFWVVHLWGIPPFPGHRPEGVPEDAVPVQARNHMTSYINMGGEAVAGGSVPQPVEPAAGTEAR